MAAKRVCAATDRDAWLAARRTGVTATDIVTILGLNPYGSEYALYWEKQGTLAPFAGNPLTDLGLVLEPYVLGLMFPGVVPTGELYRNAERPWQMATPDLWMVDAVAEVKTWADHDRGSWDDGMPPRVRAQVLWQMDTLGVATGHVGVLFLPSGVFESRVLEHATTIVSPENTCRDCQDLLYMRQAGEAFWGRVREGLPPFPDGSPATLAAVKALHESTPAGQRDIDGELWAGWEQARETLSVVQEQARQAEAALRLELGDAGTGLVGGVPVVKRTVYDVAGKTIERKPYHVDKLTRIKGDGGDDGDDD